MKRGRYREACIPPGNLGVRAHGKRADGLYVSGEEGKAGSKPFTITAGRLYHECVNFCSVTHEGSSLALSCHDADAEDGKRA